MENMKTKHKNIKRIMKAKGMTLDELAVKMGVKTPQVAFYRVRHAKKLSTIKAVAKALGVRADEIR